MICDRLVPLVVVALLSACAPPATDIALPGCFSDHMVLQRDMPIRIWGQASPNSLVKVQLTPSRNDMAVGGHAEVVSTPEGKWEVTLRPLPACRGLVLQVSGAQTLTFEDIAVGEVWLASGQSNMEWPLRAVNDADRELAAANYPEIRLLKVPRRAADQPADDLDAQWVTCRPETAKDFSAVAYFFGRELLENLSVPNPRGSCDPVPIGLIDSTWGGTAASRWISPEGLAAEKHLTELMGPNEAYLHRKKLYERQMQYWPAAVEQAKQAGKEPPAKPQAPTSPPVSDLYNGMIAPLTGYPIRGVIWYQGEADASPSGAKVYRQLFPALIADWRDRWAMPRNQTFPFLYVQLANFMQRQDEPVNTAWAMLREAQLMTLAVPKTGMAVTIDIGDADDIHPRNKQEVGRRLALWALADVYDRDDVMKSGPILRTAAIRGQSIRVTFDHVAMGLQAGVDGKAKSLEGFAIAGRDGKYVWAEASVDGDAVIVQSPKIPQPRNVRYAWGNNPAGNLYNTAGLPASPFRTERIYADTRRDIARKYAPAPATNP